MCRIRINQIGKAELLEVEKSLKSSGLGNGHLFFGKAYIFKRDSKSLIWHNRAPWLI